MVSGSGGTSLSSPSGPSTPRVATRRVSRFSPRPFSSPLVAVRNVGRPPIVLEWSATVLRIGYAEQFQPQHILPLPQDSMRKMEDYNRKKKEEELPSSWVGEEESRWYVVVSPIIRQVFDRLMVDPTSRRVVIVTKPYPFQFWEVAVKEALWNLGVPAVAFLNFLEVVPMALGWNRGLVVHVGQDQSHFQASVDGHPLPFTYQVVPCGYRTAVEDASKIKCQWDENMEKAWLDENNPNSLTVALLKCLEECPIDTRKDVIGNLLVCGDTLMVVPDLSRRLALKVKSVLASEGEESGSSIEEDDRVAPAKEEAKMTFVPIGRKALKPLSDHVEVLACAPYRADLISWVGGSVYSTIWHRHDDDQDENSRVQWVFSPSSAAE